MALDTLFTREDLAAIYRKARGISATSSARVRFGVVSSSVYMGDTIPDIDNEQQIDALRKYLKQKNKLIGIPPKDYTRAAQIVHNSMASRGVSSHMVNDNPSPDINHPELLYFYDASLKTGRQALARLACLPKEAIEREDVSLEHFLNHSIYHFLQSNIRYIRHWTQKKTALAQSAIDWIDERKRTNAFFSSQGLPHVGEAITHALNLGAISGYRQYLECYGLLVESGQAKPLASLLRSFLGFTVFGVNPTLEEATVGLLAGITSDAESKFEGDQLLQWKKIFANLVGQQLVGKIEAGHLNVTENTVSSIVKNVRSGNIPLKNVRMTLKAADGIITNWSSFVTTAGTAWTETVLSPTQKIEKLDMSNLIITEERVTALILKMLKRYKAATAFLMPSLAAQVAREPPLRGAMPSTGAPDTYKM